MLDKRQWVHAPHTAPQTEYKCTEILEVANYDAKIINETQNLVSAVDQLPKKIGNTNKNW